MHRRHCDVHCVQPDSAGLALQRRALAGRQVIAFAGAAPGTGRHVELGNIQRLVRRTRLRSARGGAVQTTGSLSVDVIGLQEVTPYFLAHLLSQPWLRAQYCVSDVNGSTLDRYGVVLLSRVPVRRFLLLPLPSMMSRRLLVADFGPLAVATVHLESMRPCVEERIVQLDLVCRALAQAPGAVLMGDMNFDKDSREEGTRDASYRDLWAELAPDQPGWTIDNARNTMRHALGKSATPARLDRILLRGDWQGRSIRLLGTEPIAPELHLSDHFGLHATLDRRRST